MRNHNKSTYKERKIEDVRRKRKELEKIKQVNQKIKERKKKQVLERAEQQEQKTVQELIQKAASVEQRVQERERIKRKELEKKKQDHEQKLKEKIISAQQNILEQEEQKWHKFMEKKYKEQVAMSRIEQKRQKNYKISQMKRAHSEKKLIQVLGQKKIQKEEKRNQYIDHQIGLEEKYNQILHQKQQKGLNLRYRSQSRDAKILETREKERQLLEERKVELIVRQTKAFEKVQKQKDLSERRNFLQQEQRKLKELNKQMNKIRQYRREEFKSKRYLDKAKDVESKIILYDKERQKLMLERLRLSTESTLQRIQIKETLRQMSITKKYNITKVQVLMQEKFIYIKKDFSSISKLYDFQQKCQFKSIRKKCNRRIYTFLMIYYSNKLASAQHQTTIGLLILSLLYQLIL